jgi:hypothetical protein
MTKPLDIAISPSIAEYFDGIVATAIASRNLDATVAARRYLVGLLCDFAHPDEDAGSTLSRPLTFLLHEAMDSVGPERFRRLRTLGDGVLYAVGFFGPHIDLRGADRGYAVTVGSTAYDHAAAMLRRGARAPLSSRTARTPEERRQVPDVLGELAVKFERFVEVLADVADGTLARSARDERSVVKLYERWLRTGSARLADELAARGLVPQKNKGGIN